MSQLSPILRDSSDNGLAFWCPGCNTAHRIQHGAGAGPRWGWNGSADKPTFTPSVRVKSGHYASGYDGTNCWCTFNAECVAAGDEPSGFQCGVCHSFVTDGRIQFLADCTHSLAGQTVDLPPWPDR
mgnify:FL=1